MNLRPDYRLHNPKTKTMGRLGGFDTPHVIWDDCYYPPTFEADCAWVESWRDRGCPLGWPLASRDGEPWDR